MRVENTPPTTTSVGITTTAVYRTNKREERNDDGEIFSSTGVFYVGHLHGTNDVKEANGDGGGNRVGSANGENPENPVALHTHTHTHTGTTRRSGGTELENKASAGRRRRQRVAVPEE